MSAKKLRSQSANNIIVLQFPNHRRRLRTTDWKLRTKHQAALRPLESTSWDCTVRRRADTERAWQFSGRQGMKRTNKKGTRSAVGDGGGLGDDGAVKKENQRVAVVNYTLMGKEGSTHIHVTHNTTTQCKHLR